VRSCGEQASISGQRAQPAVAVDRFARKIVQFLMSACAARSRQLNGNPFGGEVVPSPSPIILFALPRPLVLAFFSLAFLPHLEA
jgi:hypothetical protein